MFNLLVSYDENSWNKNPYKLPVDRYLEHTTKAIRDSYLKLDNKTIEKLKSFPTIFVIERESIDSRIGYITDVKVHSSDIKIYFEFDDKNLGLQYIQKAAEIGQPNALASLIWINIVDDDIEIAVSNFERYGLKPNEWIKNEETRLSKFDSIDKDEEKRCCFAVIRVGVHASQLLRYPLAFPMDVLSADLVPARPWMRRRKKWYLRKRRWQ